MALDPLWFEKKQAILAGLAAGISRAVLRQRYGVSLQVLRSLEAERLGEMPAPKTVEQRRWEKINRMLQVMAKERV